VSFWLAVLSPLLGVRLGILTLGISTLDERVMSAEPIFYVVLILALITVVVVVTSVLLFLLATLTGEIKTRRQ
jgi:hypothetical protein